MTTAVDLGLEVLNYRRNRSVGMTYRQKGHLEAYLGAQGLSSDNGGHYWEDTAVWTDRAGRYRLVIRPRGRGYVLVWDGTTWCPERTLRLIEIAVVLFQGAVNRALGGSPLSEYVDNAMDMAALIDRFAAHGDAGVAQAQADFRLLFWKVYPSLAEADR